MRKVKWVDVSQPHNRKKRLINHSRLVEINEQNPNSTAIFEDNLTDTFYPQRPKHMEEVCLYDFVADYVKCGVNKDGNIVYRKLNKVYSLITGCTIQTRRTKRRTILFSFTPLCPLSQ